MGKSQRLQLSDVRAVFAIVDACREQWDDVQSWPSLLVRGATRLVGGRVGHFVSAGPDVYEGNQGHAVAWYGWDNPREFAVFQTALKLPLGQIVPESRRALDQLAATPLVAVDLHACVGRNVWHRSDGFQQYHRPANCDAMIVSLRRTPAGGVEFLGSSRGVGERGFSRRECRILSLLHQEIGVLIGTRLATAEQRGRHGLTPRLRQTLDALLAGMGEKEIAQSWHRSPATVHRHVTSLYRHFGVRSRGELLSYYVRRQPTETAPARVAAPESA